MIKSATTILIAALLTGVLATSKQQGRVHAAMVQNGAKVSEKVERALKSKEKGWKLARKIQGRTQDIHQWKFRNEMITFSISEFSSPEAAAEQLKHTTGLISTGATKPLQSIGNEAYYVAGDSRSTSAVHFRKDNVFVIVNAPSVTLARRFARHIEKEIDDK